MSERFKHLPLSDLAYSVYFNESFEFLDAVNFEKLSITDITKLYNVVKYEQDIDYLPEQWKQIVISHLEKIKEAKKILVRHFNCLSNEQFLSDLKELKEAKGGLIHDYIDAFEDYLSTIEIASDSISTALNKHIIPLYVVLYQEKLSKYFKDVLKEYMMTAPETIELFVSEYDERHISNHRKYHIPKVFSDRDIDIIINNYLEYKFANYNVLQCLIYHKNSKDTYMISPPTRSRIKKLFKQQQDDLFKNNSVQLSNYELRIDPEQEKSKIYEHNFRHTLISYSGKWINENIDDNATLLNNLIYLFELVDSNFRYTSLPTKYSRSLLSAIFEGKNKDEYGTQDFESIDVLIQTSFVAYYQYLKKKNVSLEKIYEWFAGPYIKNEFKIRGFEISLPIENLNNVIKCKNLFSEIERLLKSFMVFQKYSSIEADIYDEETLCKYQQIKSLNGVKYIYPDKFKDISSIMFLLFSDQSMLNYLENGKSASSFVELIGKYHPTYEDFQKFNKEKIDFLIDRSIVSIDNERIIYFNNKWIIGLLKELFSKGFLDIHHLTGKYKEAYNWVDQAGWIIKGDTLFSTQEAEYLNYYLNNSVFTNSLALRNKYEHPSKLELSEEEVFKDYLMGLKVLGLIIIKINDELCIKYHEE